MIKIENSIAVRMISQVDWASYRVASGSAGMLGGALHTLLSSADIQEASAAWDQIEEHVFSQGNIYSAAEPTVSVVVAALIEDQPVWRSGRILDLLFFIVNGASVTDPHLQDRCRLRAREGLWILAKWAISHEGWAREGAMEVIEVIAPEYAELVRSQSEEH